MSDTNIDIVVRDGVDATIAPKLVAIRDAASSTAPALATLRRQINALNKAGGTLGPGFNSSTASVGVLTIAINGLTSVLNSQAAAQGKVSAATAVGSTVTRTAAVATQGAVSANVSAAASLGLLEGRTLSMNRAAANFASRVLGLGPILQAAFPIIGAIALLSVIYQAGTAFAKFYTQTKNAATLIGQSFDEIINPLRKTNDSLAVTNDKLDQTIAKLEKKPTTNGTVLALDQAREAADKLDEAVERVDKDLDKVLLKNRVGALGGLLTGQASTGDSEKLVKSQFDAIDKAREESQNRIDDLTNKQSQDSATLKGKARADALVADSKAVEGAVTQQQNAIRKAAQDAVSTINNAYNEVKKTNGQTTESFAVLNKGLQSLGISLNVGKGPGDQTANLTLLGKAAHLASEELRNINLTVANIGKNATVDKLRDQVSAQKDAIKEAAAEWKKLEAAYVSYNLKIAEGGKKATPQQDLAFLEQQRQTLNPLNTDKLNAKELPLQNAIDSQTFGQDQLTKFANLAKNMTLYGSALKETTELDRVFQEAQKKGLTLDQDTIDLITLNADYVNQQLPLQQEKTRIQKDAMKAEEDYQRAVTASETVMRDYPQLADGISRELNKLKIAHDDLKNPLNEFNRGIEQQKALLGQYGDQLTVSTQVDALANELRSKGVTNYRELAEAQRGVLTQQLAEQRQQSANNALYEDTVGVLEKLTEQRKALTTATNNELSAEAKQIALLKNQSQTNDAKLSTGQDTSNSSILKGALTQYVTITTVAKSIKDTLGSTFKTLADGTADAIARAIVDAKNLGQALKDVARSAVQELISGLIKLGIQLLIIKAAKALFGDDASSAGQTAIEKQIAGQIALTAVSLAAMAAVTAAGVTAATTLSAVWWPVAEAVSLATLGSNAIPATIGIATVAAIGTAASVPKLAGGGMVYGAGTTTSDSILARLSNGEAVLSARTVNMLGGSPAIDALNSGTRVIQGPATSPSSTVGGASKPMQVEVYNFAGVGIQVQQIDENRVRIIARSEADASVRRNADTASAAAVANANSKTSKAMRRYTTASRRRAA